jgi:hypothetical protein
MTERAGITQSRYAVARRWVIKPTLAGLLREEGKLKLRGERPESEYIRPARWSPQGEQLSAAEEMRGGRRGVRACAVQAERLLA